MRTIKHSLQILVYILGVAGAYAAVIVIMLSYIDVLEIPVTVSLMAAGIAVVTSIVTLTKDLAWDVINRGRLAIYFHPRDKRDCHATTFGGVIRTHYFRLRINNDGWRTVEDVEVTLENVKRFDGKCF